jgi:hypothetical protein
LKSIGKTLNPNKAAQQLQRAFDLLQVDASVSLTLANDALAAGVDKRSSWLVVKGLALSISKQALAAAEVYRELTALEPEVPEHHANLGNALLELAHAKAARSALKQAQTLGAQDANLYYALARTALELGEPLEAKRETIEALKRGLDQDLEVALFYLKCLIALDEIDLAKDNAQRLLAAPMPPELAVEFAFLLLQLSDFNATEMIARRIPKTAQQYPLALISLALSCERSNKMEQALGIREELKQFGPAFQRDASIDIRMRDATTQSLMQLDARLASREKNPSIVAALLAPLLRDARLEQNLRIALSFELARAKEDLGDIDQAMHFLTEAHEARFAQVAAAHPKLAHEDDPLLLLDQDFEVNSKLTVEDGWLDPVFVVGFPRSGTTLLEQLLDAHSALQSFDEQPFLQKCILHMQGFGLAYPKNLNQLSHQQIAALREHYFASCARVSPKLPEKARYVDKNPLNLARLPLIERLFPNAKVIVVLRSPADCVLSCFTQHFRAPAFAVAMRTLLSTAEMYGRLFSFYAQAKAKLRLSMTEMRYEDLIANTEGTARNLFDFLQLDWSDKLLQFTERAKTRVISTPSYAAVGEKINDKSLRRADKYASYFESSGALRALEHWRIQFGYARK